jgi:hypothetical protein
MQIEYRRLQAKVSRPESPKIINYGSCFLNVHYGGLEISKLQLLIKKRKKILFFVIKTLDPDLDPDPYPDSSAGDP